MLLLRSQNHPPVTSGKFHTLYRFLKVQSPPVRIVPSSNLRPTVMSINAQCDRVLPWRPWQAVWAIGPPRNWLASQWGGEGGPDPLDSSILPSPLPTFLAATHEGKLRINGRGPAHSPRRADSPVDAGSQRPRNSTTAPLNRPTPVLEWLTYEVYDTFRGVAETPCL